MADLQNLEGTNIFKTAQLVFVKLCDDQKHSFKETENEIAEETHRLDKNKASYQCLSENLQKSEYNVNSTEMVVANAWEIIATGSGIGEEEDGRTKTARSKVHQESMLNLLN